MKRPPREIDPAEYRHVRIDKRDNGVAVLTLERSDKVDRFNTFDDLLHYEVAELPRAIQKDESIRCVVLTGAGEHFSAGADLAPTRPVSGLRYTRWDLFAGEALDIVRDFVNLDKPVVTAVRGYALGLGSTLALLGDIVIAGRSAKFGDPHPRNVGVTAGDGNAALWPMLMGPQRAKYYLLTGEFITADDAERYGLVHRVVDDEDVLTESLRIADRIAENPPLAIRSTKAAVQRYVSMIVDQVVPYSLLAEATVSGSDDPAEARAAFREKRTPQFTGLDAMARSHLQAREELAAEGLTPGDGTPSITHGTAQL